MRAVAAIGFALALSVSTQVAAQDDEKPSSGDETAGNPEQGEGGETADHDDSAKDAPKAAEGTRNWSFGPYFRFLVVPSFMLKLFSDLAPSPANVGFGASATYRTDSGSPNFEMGIGYTSYSFTGPFRTKGGDRNDTEFWESNLGLVHLTGSVLWEAPIVQDTLGFQYGVGLDLGIVTGKIKRTEAYQQANGSWAKCTAPGVPLNDTCLGPAVGANVKGEQYGVTQQNIPPVMGFPMLPRVGLRYAPIPDLWVRLDAGYGVLQFWLGLSAAYAPKM